MKLIQTDRLTLLPQLAEHADAMFAVLSDPAIYEYENTPPASIDWLRQRFARLESRMSPDRQQQWLNWVVQLQGQELIGYVQATLCAGAQADARAGRVAALAQTDTPVHAMVAYEFASRYWGQGLASEAVAAMLAQLRTQYRVDSFSAVLRQPNLRSLRLLQRLGFAPANAQALAAHEIEADERVMLLVVD
jgi:RimJ/RimL family protein N-acetyltransferase